MSAQPSPAQPEPRVRTVKLPFPLQQGETILKLVRKHWFFLWPLTVLWTLYAIVPVVVLTFVLDLIGILDDLTPWYWIPVAIWLLYWLFRLILNWYRYHHDIWVVTNQRIIDSYKSHPFDLRLQTADLVNVQDIGVQRKGLFATVLHFGDVVCATAGADDAPFIIGGVPDPEHIQLLIDAERDRERMRASGGPAGTV